jgi:hypothetical protein
VGEGARSEFFHKTSSSVPSSASVMQHFLNNCSTVFPVILFHAAVFHSASFEGDALSILSDGLVGGKSSDSNQASYS